MAQLTMPISTSEKSFQQKDEAKKIIRRSTLYAAGLGFIPIPLLDAVSITGIQIWMVRDIAKVYNIPFKRHMVKSFIGSVIGNTGAIGIVKFIPVVGSMLGGTTVSVGAATATYALGQLFMEHFNQGGTLLDFDPVKSRAYFQKLYEEEEATVQALKKENSQQHTHHQKEVLASVALKEIETELKAEYELDTETTAALQKIIAALEFNEKESLTKHQEYHQLITTLEADKEKSEITIVTLKDQLQEEQDTWNGQEKYYLKNQKEDQEQLAELNATSEALQTSIAALQQQKLGLEETAKTQRTQYLTIQQEKIDLETDIERYLAVQEEQEIQVLNLKDSNKQLQQATVGLQRQVQQETGKLQQQTQVWEAEKKRNRWFWLLLPLLLLLGWIGGRTYGNQTTDTVTPQEQVQPQQQGIDESK